MRRIRNLLLKLSAANGNLTENCRRRAAVFITSLTLLAPCSLTAAVLFTTDTFINFNDQTYEGQALIASNCVLTVDGPHGFASLQLLAGAVLTHSSSTNGFLENRMHFAAEPHTLVSTNSDNLLNTNVDQGTIAVRDATGTIVYTNAMDYLVSSGTNGLTAIQRRETSTIPDGAMVLVDYNAFGPAVAAGLRLTLTNDLLIDQAAAIRADFKGYGGGLGPSAGYPDGSGAGNVSGRGRRCGTGSRFHP